MMRKAIARGLALAATIAALAGSIIQLGVKLYF